MANTSIYQAFERMWQHVIVAIDSRLGMSLIEDGTLTEKVQANPEATADVSAPQVRNISAGTEDLEAGVSELPTGTIYFVYE